MVTVIFLIIFVTSLVLLVLVLAKNWRNPINQSFSLVLLGMILWIGSIYLMNISANVQNILLYSRLSFVGSSIIPTAFLLFCESFPKKPGVLVSLFLKIVLFMLMFGFIVSAPTNFLIQNVAVENSINKFTYTPYYPSFLIYITLVLTYAFFILWKKYKTSIGISKQQIFYIFFGSIISAILSITTNLLLPIFIKNDQLASFGPLAILIFAGTSYYAIIAHRLFDIKVIIRRTVVYSVLLAFVLGVYSTVIFASASLLGSPANIGRQTMVPNLIAALLIAVGFEPLRKYLTKITDKYLFKGSYEPEAVIKQLASTLISVVALDEALISMMSIITQAMRISHTAVIIIHNDDDSPEANQVRVHSVGYKIEARNHLIKMTPSSPIIRFAKTDRKLVVIEELNRRVEDEAISSSKVKKMIKSITTVPIEVLRQIELKSQVVQEAEQIEAAIIIPIIVRDKVIGILFIGPKLSGDSFTDGDLKMLEIVSSQTAQAIEQSRLYEEDQAKSEFVSIASHELLTPTSAIEGYLSMILDENMATVDKTAKRYLTRVYSSARRLSNLVKDLLSVSRIESGRIKINIEPTVVEPIIESAVADLLPTAKEKKLSLKYIKTDKALPKAMIDGEKLTQIIINLIGNALKYTKEGSVLVLSDKERDKIKIIVEDTGIGIKKEHRDHLFEKFYRVDNTETIGIVGSGLGLYITKSVIEMMNGTIEVESTEWKGSRFIVKLPTARILHNKMKVQSS